MVLVKLFGVFALLGIGLAIISSTRGIIPSTIYKYNEAILLVIVVILLLYIGVVSIRDVLITAIGLLISFSIVSIGLCITGVSFYLITIILEKITNKELWDESWIFWK